MVKYKKCVVESNVGFKILGKTVNPNIPVILSEREIFMLFKKQHVKVFEILKSGEKVRLSLSNYNKDNGEVELVVEEEISSPVEIEAPVVATTVELENEVEEETDEIEDKIEIAEEVEDESYEDETEETEGEEGDVVTLPHTGSPEPRVVTLPHKKGKNKR